MDSLIRGAVVMPFWEGGGSDIFTSIRHHSGRLVNGPTWKIGEFGPYLDFVRTSSQQCLFARPLIHTSKTWSVGVVFRNDDTGANTGTLYSEGDSGSIAAIMLNINQGTLGGVSLDVWDDPDANDVISVGGAGTNDGEWHVVVARERTASLRDLWLDGTSIGVSTATQSSRGTIDKSAVGCHNKATVEQFVDAAIALVVVWPKRNLSDLEIRRFSDDPFAVLRPPRHRVYRVPAAVGASALSDYYRRLMMEVAA